MLARLGLGYLLVFPTLLLYSPLALRIPAGFLVFLLLLRDAGRWRRGPLPVHWRQLVSLPGGRWRALTRSNDSVPLELVGAPTVSRDVVRLDFLGPDGRVSLVLARDALTASVHRRLRVRLRWDGPAREFTGRIRSQSGT